MRPMLLPEASAPPDGPDVVVSSTGTVLPPGPVFPSVGGVPAGALPTNCLNRLPL